MQNITMFYAYVGYYNFTIFLFYNTFVYTTVAE